MVKVEKGDRKILTQKCKDHTSQTRNNEEVQYPSQHIRKCYDPLPQVEFVVGFQQQHEIIARRAERPASTLTEEDRHIPWHVSIGIGP